MGVKKGEENKQLINLGGEMIAGPPLFRCKAVIPHSFDSHT
jgi:hypothetical protein